MDLRINATSPAASVSAATSALNGPLRAGASQRAVGLPQVSGQEKGGFANVLQQTLQSVSAAQNEASRLQREVQLENPNVSLEETMVAMQKAQIGFQATLNVRNRLVQAYTDIMNMTV